MALIRDVKISDTERLLEIYAYYVLYTAVSFETEVPSYDEFKSRIETFTAKYPYIVIEEDGRVMGYAYAHAFVGRAAYDRSCELTIYLDKDAKGKGYGRALYEELESRLKSKGILNLYSCIGDPDKEDEYLTKDSERFHAALGFKKVGDFCKCGHKFGRWYNMIWMEKIIGEHGAL